MKFTHIRWKYKTVEGFAYPLKCQYAFLQLPFSTPYFAITADGKWLLMFENYAWDGATKFPDFDWIKTPSAIHDALHEAIRLGCIPESDNDLIDEELNLAICGNYATRKSKIALLKLRGWYVKKATGTVDEKAGVLERVYELPALDGEISLAEYYKRSRV